LLLKGGVSRQMSPLGCSLDSTELSSSLQRKFQLSLKAVAFEDQLDELYAQVVVFGYTSTRY
jgi:hypothetical protein